jgi:hypothetical protein
MLQKRKRCLYEPEGSLMFDDDPNEKLPVEGPLALPWPSSPWPKDRFGLRMSLAEAPRDMNGRTFDWLKEIPSFSLLKYEFISSSGPAILNVHVSYIEVAGQTKRVPRHGSISTAFKLAVTERRRFKIWVETRKKNWNLRLKARCSIKEQTKWENVKRVEPKRAREIA